ncbi:LOW QUALITY PROTEIN: protein KRBA1 [Sminthopsis crassicaudata]|uniref:LOW QUALITY PROTEIN: protein KRBA1 n=1 Tax=Sminthopsis crassicaudata TaxID=9301 RepID=UPI003D69E7D9
MELVALGDKKRRKEELLLLLLYGRSKNSSLGARYPTPERLPGGSAARTAPPAPEGTNSSGPANGPPSPAWPYPARPGQAPPSARPAASGRCLWTFEDLAVKFSADEWHLLEEWQREFHRGCDEENYETLVSLGTAQLLPLSAFLSLTEPHEDMGDSSCSDGEWERPGGALQVGQQQGSLHLNALVRLVKEIPEFLFGETKAMETPETPESKESGSEGEKLSLDAMIVDSSPLQGLLNCLPEIPVSRPALAVTPASSSSSSSLQGDGDRELRTPELGAQTLYPYELAAKTSPLDISRNPSGKGNPETSANQLNTPGFPGTQEQKQLRIMERGSPSESSPLQGLINCLKEILVQGPQHPQPLATGSFPQSSPREMRLITSDRRPRGPPWAVKAEAISENSPLQGLLNCLKEIPEAQTTCAGLPGGAMQRQTDGSGTWQKNSGVKMEGTPEDVWTQSPPSYIHDTPVSCELTTLNHSSSTSSSIDSDGNPRVPELPGWAPMNQGMSLVLAGSAQSSPLEALETYLKDIPLNRSIRPQPLSNPWCLSPGQVEMVQRRSDPRARKWHMEAGTTGILPSLGPHGCVKDLSACHPGHLNTPSSFSSASSTDGDLDLRSPEGSRGRWGREASPIGSSPLQGLENCLKEISTNRPHLSQPAPLLVPAGYGISARVEPRSWTTPKEGLGGESHDSLCLRQGGKEVPSESLNLGSTQTRVCWSAQHQTGDKGRTTEAGPWKCFGEGAAPKPSPLRCLENSLREISAMRPLRFSCLASPSLSSGSSPSSSHSSSSSSSGGGSEGEDQRLEPELWRTRLKECSPFPIPQGPVSQASSHPSPLTSSTNSPATNRHQGKRTEPGDWRTLNAALKAEETSRCSPRLHGKDVPSEASSGFHSPSSTETGSSADTCPAPDREETPDVPTPSPSSGEPEVDEDADGPKAVPGELSVASPKDAKPDPAGTKARDLTGLVHQPPDLSRVGRPHLKKLWTKCRGVKYMACGLPATLSAPDAEAVSQSHPPETPEGIRSWAGPSALTSQDAPSPPRPDRGHKRLCSLGDPAAGCSAAQTGTRFSSGQTRSLAETPSKTPRLALPPGAPSPATLPLDAPQASCRCGDALRGELLSLGAALTQQLARLSSALASLSQDVSVVKTRVKSLGRDFRSHQRLGRRPRPWHPCSGYRRRCHVVRGSRLGQKKPAQARSPQCGPKGPGSFLQQEPRPPPGAPPAGTPVVLTTPLGGPSPCSLLLARPCPTLPVARSPLRLLEDQSPPPTPVAGSASHIAPPPSPEEGFQAWRELEPCTWKPALATGVKGAWSQQSSEASARRPGEVSAKALHGGPG